MAIEIFTDCQDSFILSRQLKTVQTAAECQDGCPMLSQVNIAKTVADWVENCCHYVSQDIWFAKKKVCMKGL